MSKYTVSVCDMCGFLQSTDNHIQLGTEIEHLVIKSTKNNQIFNGHLCCECAKKIDNNTISFINELKKIKND